MENNELDLVVFQDDQGNEITMEVIDYFFYEGDEYAMLTDYDENDNCATCAGTDCSDCDKTDEVIIMKVVPVGEDEEEFLPVDEKLAEKLIEMLEDGAFDDDFDDEDEDE